MFLIVWLVLVLQVIPYYTNGLPAYLPWIGKYDLVTFYIKVFDQSNNLVATVRWWFRKRDRDKINNESWASVMLDGIHLRL